MLLNPDPSDWLNFRRTLDGWGYSPLDQINRDNVSRLQLQWSWTLRSGESEPTPLVSNGIMYLPNPDGGVQSLDAANGELLWDFKPSASEVRIKAADLPPGASRKGISSFPVTLRNIALYGDKVYTAVNGRLLALNASTGKVVWDHQVADPALRFHYSAGPIVVKGKIIAGLTGCEFYKDASCFISAHDPETGKELWRTETVARPGQPGGESWGDLPLMFRAGGDTWQAGTYDPVTDLIYWGTAEPKPWARFQRGTDGDALYTNSTLAINPETGKIAWHYQHLPGENHDMDEALERVLVDYDGRQSVFSMGKLGILWELDRKTGGFRSAHDLGYQNIVTLNSKTGKVTYRPEAMPRSGVEVSFCPSTAGFKGWRAMAYHPETRAFYIPLNLNCQKGVFADQPPRAPGGGGPGGMSRVNQMHPDSPDGMGEFVAMDVRTGKVLWRHRTRTPMNTAALTTGGGLVVVGDWDRYLYVHDAATGKILFQTRLTTSVQGFPITYAVRGKQYLAVPVGTGGPSWSGSLPTDLLKEKSASPAGNALFVFALP